MLLGLFPMVSSGISYQQSGCLLKSNYIYQMPILDWKASWAQSIGPLPISISQEVFSRETRYPLLFSYLLSLPSSNMPNPFSPKDSFSKFLWQILKSFQIHKCLSISTGTNPSPRTCQVGIYVKHSAIVWEELPQFCTEIAKLKMRWTSIQSNGSLQLGIASIMSL